MQNYLIRRLLFHIFRNSASVTTATGWTKQQIDVLTDHSDPETEEAALFMNPGVNPKVIGVIHSTIAVFRDLSEISLQEKLDEIELGPENSYDRNLGHMPVEMDDRDFLHYARLSVWTLDQAACLSIGLKPVESTLQIIETVGPLNIPQETYFQEFHQRRQLLVQSQEVGRLSKENHPFKLLSFLSEMDLKIPEKMLSVIKRFNQVHLVAELPNLVDGRESGLSTRERTSLLKMIAGMAVEQYGFDPDAKRSATVTDIGQDLDTSGVHLDDKTIRDWLREAAKTLPKTS